MSKVISEITMSLDGYIAGPNNTVDNPLGDDGQRLHQWVHDLFSWREQHGGAGGESNADDEIIKESIDATGATILGRGMFSNGEGPWGDDPFRGHWGDNPPYHHPVFVLTSHPREPLPMEGGTTFYFITDGIESALDQAREAAGDKAVNIAGGANAIRQYLAAGLIDQLQVHIAPMLLGGGTRLFDGIDASGIALEPERVIASPAVTHIRYRVSKVS